MLKMIEVQIVLVKNRNYLMKIREQEDKGLSNIR